MTPDLPPIPVCTEAPRVNCVVDGDTFWFAGMKYRLANVDAPDNPGEGRCTVANVRRLAASKNPPWRNAALYARSRDALVQLLNAGPVLIVGDRRDRYGRGLVRVTVNGVDAGRFLMGLGLAREWR